MAVLKVIYDADQNQAAQFGHRKYHDDLALDDLIRYIMKEEKTPSDRRFGYAVSANQAAYEMHGIARCYGKDRGLRARHMVLSFDDHDLSRLGAAPMDRVCEIWHYVAAYYGREYQMVYAVHEDTDELHIHFVMNTVSYVDGQKYRGQKEDYYKFQSYLNELLWGVYHIPLIVMKDSS